ncbi:MAG: hypothetical protein GWP10_16065, partial [Nitrospiraceae bacterium]|nr:hypothetical protein [Nitrospiraceae bacterium]
MPASYPEEINYRDYLRVILKRKWLILAALIITVSTTTIETFTMKPVYRATEELLIERENPKVLDIGQVLGLDANNRDYYQTQYGILKSKALALKVIKALHLQESTEFRPKKTGISLSGLFHSAISGLKKMLSYGKQKEVTEEDAEARRYSGLIKAYLARLHVDPIRNSRLVDIAFDGNDPRLASQIIRTHARLYIESNLERKFNMSKQAVEWLREKVKEARVKLKESEVALQNYRVKKGLASIGFEKKHSIIIKTLDQLNDALNTARIDRLQKQALYNQLKKIADKPEMIEALPAVVSSSLIEQLKLSYISLTQKYDNLRQKYGPEHPKMVRLSS